MTKRKKPSRVEKRRTSGHQARPLWMQEIAKEAVDWVGCYAEVCINRQVMAEEFSEVVEEIYLKHGKE